MKKLTLAGAAFCLICPELVAQSAKPRSVDLAAGFAQPPASARPRVWWHWMDGNITTEGIGLDLAWMERIGLGGFAVFQGAIDTPQVVPHRLDYMSPEWKQALRGALAEAERHNLEVTIAASPGWSETGGPWVKPSEAMKKLVWSSIEVEGGTTVRAQLPPVPHATGTFQTYQLQREGTLKDKLPPLPEYASDVAVVAYRITEAAHNARLPNITASAGSLDANRLHDGDVQAPAIALQQDAAQPAWLLYDYGQAQSIQAATLATTDDMVGIFGFDEAHPVVAEVESSDDGLHFRHVADIGHSSIPQRTVAFPPVSARYFRISFAASAKPQQHLITELTLHPEASMNQWERRAGFATVPNYFAIPDITAGPGSVVSKADVVNLTEKLQPDGAIEWQAPAGHWRILRLGQSLVGRENEPAPAEATGLEVDKLNAEYVRRYLRNYLATYREAVGDEQIGRQGITHLLTDSVEFGALNWTDTMLTDFQRLRGYDARPWLPALTGVVVQSTADTDRFLWDFRRTIAQLFEQNHYGVIADEMHRQGLQVYGEALEFRRPSLGDDMEMRSHTDIPMSAMWTFPEASGPNPTYVADIRGAASVAHVYGQNLVAAESMTAGPPPWTWSPNKLKRVADLEFALGVNRFHIHESTHQPLVGKAPGLTLGPYGQWFNRNETWAEEARPWIDYLARSSFMLQQGHFYADVAYFYGEEAPLTGLFGTREQTDAPVGYAFDFVNADALLHRMKLHKGLLTTGTGVRYRVLYLGGDSYRMTLPVLRRLEELVQQGAIVVGARPKDSPSLADDPMEFRRIADRLWGAAGTTAAVRTVGKGRVYSSGTPEDALRALSVPRDFDYTTRTDASVMFVHREAPGAEIYFVDSRSAKPQDIEATFRVTGRVPELWDAATGTRAAVSYRTHGDLTEVPIHLDPYGTSFVVFGKPGPASLTLPARQERPLLAEGLLAHGWLVSFPPDHGAPASASFDRLTSWSENSDAGIRYFSGTATYTREVEVPEAALQSGEQVRLDLGQVSELASVTLNGKPLGTAWKSPYRLDATGALHAGSNHLEIRVTNLWVNRLIGDAQPGVTTRYTFTGTPAYKATDPLLPSGLLGPVRFVTIR